ncbi:MAG: PKD domain-containing protein, partial [Bacteroidia bacterium]|nr:PKD domain-containing protein [Bacteroidia bacterium]
MALRLLVLIIFVTFYSFLTAQVAADFTHDFDPNSSNSCAPITIAFTNTSTNANSYSWSLDGTVFSTTASPQRSFATGGSYVICLDASDGVSSDQRCETIVINNSAELIISANNTISCAPLSAVVNITSSKIVTTATIDYGDGIIDIITPNSNSFSGSHTYTEEGTYGITVSVIDDNGCPSTATSPNLFTVQNISDLGFTVNLSSCVVPLTATFTNTTPNANDYDFVWNFGDGNTSNSVNASNNYGVTGVYNVSLSATDPVTGCTETFTINDAINSQNAVNMLVNTVDNGDCSTKQTELSFDNLPAGATVIWDFGDGNTTNGETASHGYTTAGCFTPSAQITTTAGCIFTISALSCIQSIGSNDPSFSMTGDLETCNDITGTTIQFNSNSSMATGWLWDFGDGNTSTDENPNHLYTGFGIYRPTLTTTYTDACTQTYGDSSLVVSIVQPSLTITADSTTGCIPMDATFQLSGSNDPIASIDWDFGFTTSTMSNPTVTFSNIGDYSVTANVTTTTGCLLVVQEIDMIEVGDIPNVLFSIDTLSACVDSPVSFTDLSDPTVDEWEWDFGDGGTSSNPNPIHNYSEADSFLVTLKAYYNGCPNDYEYTNYVNIAEPKARFAWGYQCGTTNTLNFTDLSVGSDSIWWDFGDGSPMMAATNPTHNYASEGTYTITQYVKNQTTGCIDDEVLVVNLINPIANYEFTRNAICIGDTLTLTNLSVGIANVSWSTPAGVVVVDDGDNGADAKFVFTQPGFFSGYTANYTTTSGCTNFISFSNLVTVSYLFPNFTFDVSNCLPADLTTTNSSVDIFGYGTTYTWEIGDSIYTSLNPTHTFTDVGSYEINLTMQDTVGCMVSIANPQSVTIEVPVPDFEWNMTDCDLREISFSNISSGTNITGFSWDFGDGNTSTMANPVHQYSANGDYTVTFTVTTSTGCVESITEVIQVYQPIAGFTGDNLSKSCPNPALITNFSNTTQGGTTWVWDFGDGGSSTIENPSHAYGTIDTFDVSLIATSVNGCVDTFTQAGYIEVGGPFASFNYSTNQSCIGAEIEFVVAGTGVVGFTWDFGDGNALNSTPTGNSDTLVYSYG